MSNSLIVESCSRRAHKGYQEKKCTVESDGFDGASFSIRLSRPSLIFCSPVYYKT
jgi:hypothetical protein